MRKIPVHLKRDLLVLAATVSCLSATPTDRASVDGGSLYYETAGDGCPIVLVGGGSAMDSRQWDNQFDFLQEDFKVIRVDPRGLGRSDPPTAPYSDHDDLAAFLDSLDIEKAVVVGLSSGGGIVLEFALTHPERVSGVIAAAPFVPGYPFSEAMQKRVNVIAASFEAGAEAFIQTVLDDPHFIPAPKNPAARERARTLIAENFKSFGNDFSPNRPVEPPLLERVEEIGAPTLLLVGELDHPDLHRRTRFLQGKIAGAKRVVLPDAGHTSNLENPEAFNRAAAEFLDTSGVCSSH